MHSCDLYLLTHAEQPPGLGSTVKLLCEHKYPISQSQSSNSDEVRTTCGSSNVSIRMRKQPDEVTLEVVKVLGC